MGDNETRVSVIVPPFRIGGLPFCHSVEFTSVAANIEGANETWDRVVELIEQITGLPTEGGTTGPMDDANVIPDSPLARRLSR